MLCKRERARSPALAQCVLPLITAITFLFCKASCDGLTPDSIQILTLTFLHSCLGRDGGWRKLMEGNGTCESR